MSFNQLVAKISHTLKYLASKDKSFFLDKNRQYVEICYRLLLNREGSEAEITHYLNLLKEGSTKADILKCFALSSEYQTKNHEFISLEKKNSLSSKEIEDIFRVILGRQPTQAEVIDKLEHIKNPMHLRDQLLWSKEFKKICPQCSPSFSDIYAWADINNGFQLLVNLADRSIGLEILKGCFESEETQFIKENIPADSWNIDLGANIGYFSILIGSLLDKTGRVFSFEPIPDLLQMLNSSIARNNLQHQIISSSLAIGDREHNVQFLTANLDETPNPGGAFLFQSEKEQPLSHSLVDVSMKPLDSLKFEKKIHFVKMDVEGAEPLVLQGGCQFFYHHRPIVLAEIHKKNLQTVSNISSKEFIKRFADIGYHAYSLKQQKGPKLEDTSEEVCNIVLRPDP